MRLGKQNTSAQAAIDMSFIFLLKRTGNSLNAPYVQVDFSPQILTTPTPNSHPNITPTPTPAPIYPAFNKDALYFTPAFILREDQSKIQKNLQCYLNLHEERVNEVAEQKQEIYVPKPSKANSYCSICRTTFDDYLTHLTLPKHQQLLKKSQYCEDIDQLCSLFRHKQKKIVKKGKAKAKVGRKSKIVKQDLNETNFTTTSTMNIEQYNLQKIIQVY